MEQRAERVVIEIPGESDVEALARMFQADMEDLGVETRLEDLRGVAAAVVKEQSQKDPGIFCRVVRLHQDGEALGVVLANFNWSLKFAGRSMWIEELYVAPEARRRGLGRELVETLLDWAELNGIRGIDLEAYRGNTPASIMYRALGFHRLGRERFYYRIGNSEFL